MVQIHHSVVTKNDVITQGNTDLITLGTTQNYIIPRATIYFVATTDFTNQVIHITRFNLRNSLGTIAGDVSSVTENNIAAIASSDHVTLSTANDDISSIASASNRVNATDG